MSDDHMALAESLEPYTGDRGWSSLARDPGEGAFYAIVAALLVVAVLVGLTMGLPAVGMVFVLLTFVGMAMLVVVSVGG